MTEDMGKPPSRGLLVIGALIAIFVAGGAFALVHRHSHATTLDRAAVTRASATSQPATTRAVHVKKKKKHK